MSHSSRRESRRAPWAIISIAAAIALRSCAVMSPSTTEQCWGDPLGVNYCAEFVQQHFWTGAIAITDARYPSDDRPGHSAREISGQLAVSTGEASALGGSIAGEVSQHVVVGAPVP